MNETPTPHLGPERVGAWPRLAAAMLDYVLSTVLTMMAAWKGWGWKAVVDDLPGMENVIGWYQPMEQAIVQAGMEGGVLGLLGATALVSIVYPMVEGATGASPGKWALGLRVGCQDGTPGSVGVYVKRYVIKFIRPVLMAMAAASGFGVLAWLSGPAGTVIAMGTLLLLAPHKQALHDKLAGTAVFRRTDWAAV